MAARLDRQLAPAAVVAALMLLLALLGPGGTLVDNRETSPASSRAAEPPGAPEGAVNSYKFPETGKTVSGRLLEYWQANGGLFRLGYPVSEQIEERSDTDGKLYSVQYFERAVLELHPENRAPYDVLGSLLGVFHYTRKYPNAAPGQQPNNSPGSRHFTETGKRLGGLFLELWSTQGGLSAFGFPLSDELVEKSELDGKTYLVQYFQRAVFELHPENQKPYNVLLAQLGTFQHRARYTASGPRHAYGLVGQGGLGERLEPELLRAQHDAGLRVRLLHLGWDVLQPSGPDSWSAQAAGAFQDRINAFADMGPDVRIVLDLGVHYPPTWVERIDPAVDQFGNTWDAGTAMGGVNVYWSPTVRQHVAEYIKRVFRGLDFKGRLWIVRVGMYGGEFLYPEKNQDANGQSFWAFDPHAQAASPVRGWKPGQPSPAGEAQRFYHWYVDNLVGTFRFFHTEIRRYYPGRVAPVTPGIGMNDRSVERLLTLNLVDPSQRNYGTGNYWQRIFARLPKADEGVLNWCSSLGDGSGNDASPNWWDWSSARLQAHWAGQNGRDIYGENRGRNPYDTAGGIDERITAQSIFKSAAAYGYLGILWVAQAQTADPSYTSLEQLKSLIARHP